MAPSTNHWTPAVTSVRSHSYFEPNCAIFFVQVRLQHNLKETLARVIPEKQNEVKEFRKKHGGDKVGEVTVDMVSNSAMCCDMHVTSLLRCMAVCEE